MTAAHSQRLIKKYPNRRLYDTQTSAYITLADVKELVLKHDNFKIVDAKTAEDLTRSVLLQIILEEETGGAPMFSSDLLAQMIRFYGNAMQGMLGKYLEGNLRSFADMQARFKEQARAMYGDNASLNQDLWAQFLNFQGPAMQNMMAAYMEQSQKMVQQMQEQMQGQARNMFASFQFPHFAGAPSGVDETSKASKAGKGERAEKANKTDKTDKGGKSH